MKKLTLFLTWCMALSLSNAYGQISHEKDYLKNYKAPDFNQNRLTVQLNVGGQNSPYQTNFNETTRLGYSQYSNSQSYQGNLNADLVSFISFSKGDNEERVAHTNHVVSNRTVNRFFFNQEWFIGAHNFGSIQYSTTRGGTVDFEKFGFMAFPMVSIGNGRLEPVHYARNAMDIERSLNKGGRLSNPYSTAELNQIADELAVINNVRAYDFRLRRIEQFKAIDRKLQDLGHVNEFDIVYFSYLADAYLYANNFIRFSGFQHELGVTQGIRFDKSMSNFSSEIQSLMSYGFYNLTYDLPQSYAIQHQFKLSVIGGLLNSKVNSQYNPDFSNTVLTGWLTGGYSLGIYPTTRTNINIGANLGMQVDAEVGFATDAFVESYYYFTPQFRLLGRVGAGYGANYNSHNYRHIISGPGQIAVDNSLNVFGSLSLSYAIF